MPAAAPADGDGRLPSQRRRPPTRRRRKRPPIRRRPTPRAAPTSRRCRCPVRRSPSRPGRRCRPTTSRPPSSRVTSTVTTRGGRVAAADIDYGRAGRGRRPTRDRAPRSCWRCRRATSRRVVDALEDLGTVALVRPVRRGRHRPAGRPRHPHRQPAGQRRAGPGALRPGRRHRQHRAPGGRADPPGDRPRGAPGHAVVDRGPRDDVDAHAGRDGDSRRRRRRPTTTTPASSTPRRPGGARSSAACSPSCSVLAAIAPFVIAALVLALIVLSSASRRAPPPATRSRRDPSRSRSRSPRAPAVRGEHPVGDGPVGEGERRPHPGVGEGVRQREHAERGAPAVPAPGRRLGRGAAVRRPAR